ncbi:MAG: DMT family transporter [Actinobacteria bacterium]|nr:DMT family transporter [Actinomycetota bacterium]
MSRRAYFHFAVSGLFWGIPYLLMKVAVRDFPPAVIVCGRVLIGAAILIPLAIHQKVLMDAIRGWRYVLPYAIFEMMIPWILITNAEKKISSGLAGLLIATVPIWSTIFASIAGDKTVWHSKRLVGIAVGFVGLVGLVGYESIFGNSDPLSIGMMLITAMSYSFAVNMIAIKLPDVSGIAINGLAMVFTAIVYLPFMITQWPAANTVSKEAALSLVTLGIFCTALAFISFFIVMKEIGPARASIGTYVNTAVAVVLGVLILSEPLTLGIIIGLPLVMIGSFLASRKPSVTS